MFALAFASFLLPWLTFLGLGAWIAGLAWAIEVTPSGMDPDLLSGRQAFTPVAQLVVSPSLPTAGTLRRLADGTHVLSCDWAMAVREIAAYRSTLERAGLWDEMERLVFDQAPFALQLGIDDGAVVATLPLTRRLDPPMVERTAALLARWRGSLLGEAAPAP